MDDPYAFKTSVIRKCFNHYYSASFQNNTLYKNTAYRLMEHLDVIQIKPQRILDVGAGYGHLANLIKKKFKSAEIVLLDLAEQLLIKAKKKAPWFSSYRYLCADTQHLPLVSQSFDCMISDMTLQWCTQIQAVLNEWRRVLKPGGFVLFSTLGPDSLRELQEASCEIDEYVHVHRFIDMHHLGDALLYSGFSDPVVDVDRVEILYPSVTILFNDLKNLAARNKADGRCRGLLTPKKMQKIREHLEKNYAKSGKIAITYEIIYAHAFVKTEQETRQLKNNSEVSIPVSLLKRK